MRLEKRAFALGCIAALFVGPVVPALADNDAPVATAKNLNSNVRVDILALKRTESNTLTLQFALVNDGTGDFVLTQGNTQLIDMAARRRYGVGLEMSGNCGAAPGEKKVCWVMFAAPPATTKSVDVQFYGTWPLTPVPVTD